MKDHETTLVKKIEAKNRKLYEENSRLQDEVFRKAPLLDKIHVYMTVFAILTVVFYLVYLVISPILPHIFK